jgi:hypothetical protein
MRGEWNRLVSLEGLFRADPGAVAVAAARVAPSLPGLNTPIPNRPNPNPPDPNPEWNRVSFVESDLFPIGDQEEIRQ